MPQAIFHPLLPARFQECYMNTLNVEPLLSERISLIALQCSCQVMWRLVLVRIATSQSPQDDHKSRHHIPEPPICHYLTCSAACCKNCRGFALLWQSASSLSTGDSSRRWRSADCITSELSCASVNQRHDWGDAELARRFPSVIAGLTQTPKHAPEVLERHQSPAEIPTAAIVVVPMPHTSLPLQLSL